MKRRNVQRPSCQQHSVPGSTPSWVQTLYSVCYIVGIRSVRCLRSASRFTRTLWRPVMRALRRAVDWLVLRHLRRLADECRGIRADLARAGNRVRNAGRGHPLQLLPVLIGLPFLAVRRHGTVFRTLLNLAAPVLAGVLLVNTVVFWRQAHFALALEYDGQSLGYIADEGTYTNAASLVEGMVIDADDSFQVERAPKLTLAVARHEEILDEQAVRDRILDTVGSSVTHTSGLYVDGVFRVFSKGGREMTDKEAVAWAVEGQERGAGELVINSIDTDGMKGGFDLEMLSAISSRVRIPIIASGGAGCRENL